MKWKAILKIAGGSILTVMFGLAACVWLLLCLGANAHRPVTSPSKFIMGFFAIDVAGPILVFLGLTYVGFRMVWTGVRNMRREQPQQAESTVPSKAAPSASSDVR